MSTGTTQPASSPAQMKQLAERHRPYGRYVDGIDYSLLRGLLEEALKLPFEGRRAFVARACHGDPKLAAALETLLSAAERPPLRRAG